MKNKILIVILLLFLSLSCVSASSDINSTGNVSLSNYDNLISDDFNQLRSLIDGAKEGDTISLSTDYVGNGEININKALTINGNGHSIDASHSSRIFKINANNVVLNNIKFLNANSGDWGGAIYTNYQIKVDNCEFINNHAYYRGAAIYSTAPLDVSNSIFSKNTAENGGAVYLESSNANFKNCKFLENGASWAAGALLSLYESNTTLDGCIFINNYATQYGAAISANNEINLLNSNFVTDRNDMEFIYYFDDWDGRNGCLYLKNNEMTSSYLWDIYYRGDTPIASPTYLKFSNNTVNSGDTIVAGNIFDDNGNTIQIDLPSPITLEVYDKNNKLVDKTNPSLDKKSGYTYTANLNNGIYRLSGSLSDDFSSDSTVVDGILNVGNVDEKFVAEVSTTYKKNKNNIILTSTVNSSMATGSITFNVNNKNYTSEIKNGQATVSISNLENGTYTVKTFYSGDSLFEAAKAKAITVIIGPYDIVITAPDLVKYFKGPERFTVSLKDKEGNPLSGQSVNIFINGQNYQRDTDSNGQARMAINLDSGVYPVLVEFGDEQVTSTVTVKSTISGHDMTKTFRNATQYYAAFLDSSGNLVKNADMEFNINGVFYTRATDDKGVARLNINLNPGKYVITAKNLLTGEESANLITVLSNMDKNYDLVKYYKNDSQYTIRLLDDRGNAVGAGVSVVFNINGVFYTHQTNESGHVQLNINLLPGDYIITADYKGLQTSNKIKVLSVIKSDDMKMKYKDGSKFKATLLNGQGNPFRGQTILFNINGVFYERITDENGVASLNINLMSGEYIITSSYNGLSVANKITIS